MRIVICEDAVNHEDGTYSIKRGGFDKFFVEIPGALQFAVLIESEISELPSGLQLFNMEISYGPERQRICYAAGHALVPEGATVGRFISHTRIELKSHGTFHIDVTIGDRKASTSFEVLPPMVS